MFSLNIIKNILNYNTSIMGGNNYINFIKKLTLMLNIIFVKIVKLKNKFIILLIQI